LGYYGLKQPEDFELSQKIFCKSRLFRVENGCVYCGVKIYAKVPSLRVDTTRINKVFWYLNNEKIIGV
jgi:hypothetical protein